MSAVAMNTIRSRLATSSPSACSSAIKRASPSRRSLARFAHSSSSSSSSSTPAAEASGALMTPVIIAVSVAVTGGLLYTLSQSSGRIGSRFEAREKTLHRDKFLHEGNNLDEKLLH